MKHLNEALSKSMIKKIKNTYNNKYILLWITGSNLNSVLKHFPELKKYGVSNKFMHYSKFYLINIDFAKDIIKPISELDSDLDIYEVIVDDGVTYDQIKETINMGVDLDYARFNSRKINAANSEKKITFTYLEKNEL